jgi:hypothetical protein
MILRKAGAALAAGCTMIVKPSPETPLSVLALAELAMQAGFPKGVFSVLTTSLENTPPLSEALCRHPLIKKVTFTGSVGLNSTSHWSQTEVFLDSCWQVGRKVVFRWFEESHSRVGRKLPFLNL